LSIGKQTIIRRVHPQTLLWLWVTNNLPGATLHKVSLARQLLRTRTSTNPELLVRKTNLDLLNFPVTQVLLDSL